MSISDTSFFNFIFMVQVSGCTQCPCGSHIFNFMCDRLTSLARTDWQHFSISFMPWCLVCCSHTHVVRRKLCALCRTPRALGSIHPGRCWIPYFRCCRDCWLVHMVRQTGLPEAVWMLVNSFFFTVRCSLGLRVKVECV